MSAHEPANTELTRVEFHHMQFYVDELQSVDHYKKLERVFNAAAAEVQAQGAKGDVAKCKALYRKQGEEVMGQAWADKHMNPDKYSHLNQDLVAQLISGAGARVVGHNTSKHTRSVVVRSSDPKGYSFVVTVATTPADALSHARDAKRAKENGAAGEGEAITDAHGDLHPFSADHVHRFFAQQNGRQGAGVLAFVAKHPEGLRYILSRYQALHPKLVAFGGVRDFTHAGIQILDVAAYYAFSRDGKPLGVADTSTILRFVHVAGGEGAVLPGVEACAAEFDKFAMPAYADHWVSNVADRNVFLGTLKDTLGFTPKVDFNAGVVAAGEAIIESTVTGNSPPAAATTPHAALVDNSQVYLPVNNALSEVGHVHLYLQEIGQGIQHMAQRVDDLCEFVQHANDIRQMSGQGFTFLNIPRSYYGRLVAKDLEEGARLDHAAAERVLAALEAASLVSATGIVKLDITDEEIAGAVSDVDAALLPAIQSAVKRGRYVNMYKFLGDHVGEQAYLKIVRNQVLVDIQGHDVLYQIFTSSILQRQAGEEAPFLEYIERVCSEQKDGNGNPKPIKPGCGGFGIRNFLTLFLSIEVSKAMVEAEQALARGDQQGADRAQKMVEVFSEQLEESNPILTAISDAMTAEAEAREAADKAKSDEERASAEALAKEWEGKKLKGQEDLQECSNKYKAIMQHLRGAN